MSIAQVNIRELLTAAFARKPVPLPRFPKLYAGRWNQRGINGRSTDLEPGSPPGDASVTYSAYLKRYVVIADDTQNISYGESPDGIVWTARTTILSEPSKVYARAIGEGNDPKVLGSDFYIYYTLRNDWTTATVGRYEALCRWPVAADPYLV